MDTTDPNNVNVKEQIYQAAEQVFVQYGFDAARIDEIARLADVAKGTIYYYFPSKHEIFISLVERRMEQLISALERRMRGVSTIEEFLQVLPETRLRFFTEHGELAQWMTQSFRLFPEDMQKRIVKAVCRLDDVSAESLKKVLPENYPVDARTVVDMINGAIGGLIGRHIFSGTTVDGTHLTNAVATVFSQGLRE